MKQINTVMEMTLYQMTNSLLLVFLKSKGFGDEHVRVLLEGREQEVVGSLMESFTEHAAELLADREEMLTAIDPEEMVEIANEAVKANLQEDGYTPKFESTHGYSCALEALKIAKDRRGFELFTSEGGNAPLVTEEEVNEFMHASGASIRAEFARQVQINTVITGMVDIYNFRLNEGALQEDAVEEALEWVAEKYGVADLSLLGLDDAQLKEVCSKLGVAIEKLKKGSPDGNVSG